MTIKGETIQISPFHIVQLLELEIGKYINDHMHATAKAIIEDEQQLSKVSENTEVRILKTDETGEAISLFIGVICEYTVSVEGNLRILQLTAKSKTCLLDILPQTRVFQKTSQTYKDIISWIENQDKKNSVIVAAGAEQACELAVQYEETDWEFVKRMAGCLGMIVVPDCTNHNNCFYIGKPRKADTISLSSASFSRNYSKTGEMFQVIAKEKLDLCAPVIYNQKRLYVYSVTSTWCSGELSHKYDLRPEAAFTVQKNNCSNLAGLSLMGTVREVNADKIRVSFACEEAYHSKDTKWYDFATVYSSPGGVGWYCMPEAGERVRIYFPDSQEIHAYAISAVHYMDHKTLRKNPDEKSIRTIHDKEIRLTPDKIVLTNHKGLSIVLDDKKGITIKSDSTVKIDSSGAIELFSERGIQLLARKGIVLKENGNSLVISGGIRQSGLMIQYR